MHQVAELLALREPLRLAVLSARLAVLRGLVIDPLLSTGAEQQRVLEALGLEVAEHVLVGAQSAGERVQTAVPLVHHEGERPSFAMLKEYFPAELIVIFLLRADVQ